MPETRTWFPGARLNYAENLLRFNGDNIAVTSARETGDVVHYSFRQLREMVRKLAAALRVNGLQCGDRVAAVITNSIDGVVIALATISIGAIFSSTATDMGAQVILTTLNTCSILQVNRIVGCIGQVSSNPAQVRLRRDRNRLRWKVN